jgi:predicted RNA-binding protein with PUA-like domain
MNIFLAKTEPSEFSITDLKNNKTTDWDGVHNYQALGFIRSWNIGDKIIIYHSVKESRIVGLAQVISEPKPDPNDTRGYSWLATIEFIREFPEEQRITLKQIKQTGLFTDFYLVRQSRLSVMPCPQEFINWLVEQGLDLR